MCIHIIMFDRVHYSWAPINIAGERDIVYAMQQYTSTYKLQILENSKLDYIVVLVTDINSCRLPILLYGQKIRSILTLSSYKLLQYGQYWCWKTHKTRARIQRDDTAHNIMYNRFIYIRVSVYTVCSTLN